jgi:predicted nucleic acid-binding protein
VARHSHPAEEWVPPFRLQADPRRGTRPAGYRLVEVETPPDDLTRFLKRVRGIATLVRPTERVKAVKDDPDDNAILECALAAQAQLIVTADHHLLKLSPYRGIGITHPRELKRIFASDFEQAA